MRYREGKSEIKRWEERETEGKRKMTEGERKRTENEKKEDREGKERGHRRK